MQTSQRFSFFMCFMNFIKFSAIMLLVHRKGVILTHSYTRPQSTVHSELKSAITYIIFKIKNCGESLNEGVLISP